MWPQRILSSALSRRAKLVFESPARIRCFYISTPSDTSSGLDLEAKSLVESCEPTILARAVHYLYTKETKSSFAIEGEVPSAKRTERFVAALTSAAKFDTFDPRAFIKLQNQIVDPRYAATGWRTVQSFAARR